MVTGSVIVAPLTGYVLVPVANYTLPALVVVTAGAFAVGRLYRHWHAREANRHPSPSR